MTPTCHNRPAYAAGRMVHGVNRETGAQVQTWVSNGWFADVCRVWDGVQVGQNGERYPEAHGFDCSGCRWLPEAQG